MLYYRQRQLDDALTYFERFFEAARALKDERVLDVARVNLGAVRAALTFEDYIQVGLQTCFIACVKPDRKLHQTTVLLASPAILHAFRRHDPSKISHVMQVADTDLQTLLLWKNVRMPFKEQTPVTLSVQ